MRTIVWWTVWGLAVATGVVGLLESSPHHVHLLLAIPVLTGAVAAAFIRLKYEYHHAIQHAKWLVVSSLFLMGSFGFLYMKAHAYGPFSTGTAHKAFLGTTFGMSIPEVERAIGRRMTGEAGEKPITEKAQEWLAETLPLPARPSEERYALSLVLYRMPCVAAFTFKKGHLGGVRVEFEPAPSKDVRTLVARIREELQKEYEEDSSHIFRKEAVEATLVTFPADHNQVRAVVSLQYLPFAEAAPAPLAVEANVF